MLKYYRERRDGKVTILNEQTCIFRSESQTQVFQALSTVISYLPRSNVLWYPTLELLSQTRFLLLLSGSYGYDRNCWFQAMMIINVRNKLPFSCLGSMRIKLNW